MPKKHDKPAMEPHSTAHPGLEIDGKGHPIPVGKRVVEDRQKVRRAGKAKKT
ncbi:MAG TPA: hypothetical protein VHZ78_13310 [Rhizomicrobium sp.]|jgi:hypothetical protein|nr:hypothetical protein [Rhizomicrobium sp.]